MKSAHMNASYKKGQCKAKIKHDLEDYVIVICFKKDNLL